MTGGTCPGCGKGRLHDPWTVKQVFPHWDEWGATAMLERAELVCSFCKAVKINGEWTRMMSVSQRAYNLSRSGTKSKREYVDVLQAGDGDF